MIKVSIIIVNFNQPVLLANCIKSIIEYTKKDLFELIISDNNSTVDKIDEIKKTFPNIILIKNLTNRGFAAANNQGIEIANGKYILLLNNDTVFIEDSLSKIIEYFNRQSNPNEILLGCKLLNADNSHQLSTVDFDSLSNLFGESIFINKIFSKSKVLNRYNHYYTYPNTESEVDVIKGAFIFGTAFRIRELNGFDERFFFYNEEVDLCYRHKELGGKVIYFPGTSIVHFGGASTASIPWFMYKNLSIAKIKFFQKHFPNYKKILAIALHFIGMFIRVPIYLIISIFRMDKNYLMKASYFLKLLLIYPKNIFK